MTAATALTVSFALGTDPDINTVNVNNRVQTALSQLAAGGAARRADGAEEILGGAAVHRVLQRRTAKQDPLFITNYVIINVLDAMSPHARRRAGQPVRQAELLDADLVRYRAAAASTWRRPTSSRRSRRRTCRRRSGGSARGRSSNDQQFQFNVQTQGRLTTPAQFGNIVLRANPDGSVLRVKDVARVEIGAQNEDSESRIDGKPAVPIGDLSRPGRQCGDHRRGRAAARSRASARRFPPGLHYNVVYDTTTFVSDTIREVLKTLAKPSCWS